MALMPSRFLPVRLLLLICCFVVVARLTRAGEDSWTMPISDSVRLSMTNAKLFKLYSATGSLTDQEKDQLARTFLSLHTALYRQGVFPLRGVFSYGGHPSLPRESIEAFIRNASSALPQSEGRCLEWGVHYTLTLPNCKERWSFEYDPNNPRVDFDKKLVFGAVDAPLPKALLQVAGTFDVVVCTQVFEHIRYPHVAARTLTALLKGGGHLLWSAPFMEPMHKVPEDHFRYTLEGAHRMLTDVGFTVLRSFVGGSPMLTSARILGYQRQDLDADALKDMLIDADVYTSRHLPVQADVYWGTYVLAQKPKTRSSLSTMYLR